MQQQEISGPPASISSHSASHHFNSNGLEQWNMETNCFAALMLLGRVVPAGALEGKWLPSVPLLTPSLHPPAPRSNARKHEKLVNTIEQVRPA
jgi:hypothetical protein